MILRKQGKTKFLNSSQMINNSPTTTLTRKPAVAGTFYSENPENLENKIDALLQKSSLTSSEGRLQILFVPHAGIDYSGTVAAAGFKQIEGKNYSKVILLGPSHRKLFNHAAIFTKGVWETPLGKVEISETLADKLMDNSRQIISDTSSHEDEHSLEVELIFLQKVLNNFQIVPILISQSEDTLINSLAEKISANFDEQTLLVVSTDLSHYPSYDVANLVDKETISGILSGKKNVFEQTLLAIENKHYSNLDTCACGENAIKVGLKVAEILEITDFKLIKYQNSGDLSAEALAKAGVTGDKSRVVGYGAIGAWSKDEFKSFGTLDENAQKEALKIARETLENLLSGKSTNLSPPTSPALQKPLGAFVTLRNHGELRGCIGAFEPKEPLYKVIQEMALAAATKDTRFSPVRPDELKDITIEISIMTPKQKIIDWKQIKLGRDGVVIQKGSRSGTFLPQVATETGWNLEEFLGQLCSQKAGLPADCYQDPAVTLYTFEAQVFEEK